MRCCVYSKNWIQFEFSDRMNYLWIERYCWNWNMLVFWCVRVHCVLCQLRCMSYSYMEFYELAISVNPHVIFGKSFLFQCVCCICSLFFLSLQFDCGYLFCFRLLCAHALVILWTCLLPFRFQFAIRYFIMHSHSFHNRLSSIEIWQVRNLTLNWFFVDLINVDLIEHSRKKNNSKYSIRS